MKPEIKEKWILALESGKYKRTSGVLKKVKDGKASHCCLGVLCEIYIEETGQGEWRPPTQQVFDTHVFIPLKNKHDWSETVLKIEVMEWAGMGTEAGSFKFDEEDRKILHDVVPNQIDYTLAEVNDYSVKEDFSEVIPFIKKYF